MSLMIILAKNRKAQKTATYGKLKEYQISKA